MSVLDNPSFRNLWIANTVSNFGTMFGALSLTALVFLHASPTKMGLLVASSSMPVLPFAMIAGVWVDRLPRAPVMVIADLGRLLALLTVPIAAVLHVLCIEQLYAVSIVASSLSVTFDVAFRSALPTVVDREQLVTANELLSAGESVASTASPAIGGAIVQSIGGPAAVLVDATTFLVSALVLRRLPAAKAQRTPRRPVLGEALEGWRSVISQPILRPLLAMVVTYSFFSGFILTLYGLWILRGLGLSASTLGILLGAGGFGSLTGAWLSGLASRSLGIGRSIVATYVTAASLLFLTPLAGGPTWLALSMLFAEQCAGDAFWAIHNIHAVTLRQTIVPGDQLGRVNAVFLVASQGLRPVGALVAGVVAANIGLRSGLLVSSAGINVAGLWLLFSPLTKASRIRSAWEGNANKP